MRTYLFTAALLAGLCAGAQQPSYHIAKTYSIASAGGWDYLAVHAGRLYVSHGTQVNVLDEATGDSVGVILNTPGVHGIAFDAALDRGYTSNGRANNVTVFDLKTLALITQIGTGANPDAIMFEPASGAIVTCNGTGKSLSFIDPSTNTVIATTELGGKPETAVADGMGRLFVNLEDRNEIVVVDAKLHTVLQRWSIAPGEGPTGLAYDPSTHRLFAGCEKQLIVVDADKGTVVAHLPIGDGCDGVAFDRKRKLIFTSNGEGTLSVIREDSANGFTSAGTVPTKRGARTITIDDNTGTLFLPTADFEPAPAGTRPHMKPGTFQVLVMER